MPTRPSPELRRRPVALRVGVAAVLGGLILGGVTGCGAGAGEVGVTGIDTLVIPTSAPDPHDFLSPARAAGRDASGDSWFPLVPGTTWRYRTASTSAGEPELTVTVLAEPGEVAGVATTRVRTEFRAGSERTSTIDELAQDRAGNLWWFARQGAWQVGESGVSAAGLFWPAAPRRGDGWTQVEAAGVQQDITVIEDAQRIITPAGRWSDAVEARITDPTALSGQGRRIWWVAGVGPVRLEMPTGEVLDLVELAPGRLELS